MYKGYIDAECLVKIKMAEGQSFYEPFLEFCRSYLKGRLNLTKNSFFVWLVNKKGVSWTDLQYRKEIQRVVKLIQSVQRQGLKKPIKFNFRGSIEDGAHRLVICYALGHKFIKFECSELAIGAVERRYGGIIKKDYSKGAFVDVSLYQKLLSAWVKAGLVYGDFDAKKFQGILKSIPVFKDRMVLDLGCNNGRISLEISQYAKGVFGVEVNSNFWKQANITGKYIKIPFRFFNASVGDFIKNHLADVCFDALFACDILFYLSESDISLIEKLILPYCKVVILVSNETRKDGVRNPEFRFASHLEKFLIKNSFTVQLETVCKEAICVIGYKGKG